MAEKGAPVSPIRRAAFETASIGASIAVGLMAAFSSLASAAARSSSKVATMAGGLASVLMATARGPSREMNRTTALRIACTSLVAVAPSSSRTTTG